MLMIVGPFPKKFGKGLFVCSAPEMVLGILFNLPYVLSSFG
jgi:hypothetical protein